MTTPQDPFGPPGEQPPGGQPGYGQPGYGQQPGGQPAWGAPQGDGPGFGAPPPGWGQAPQQKSGTNGLAIASLITAFFCSIVGIVLGFVAKSQIKKTGQGGNGLATAGIVIGILNMLIGILLVGAGGFSAAP